MVVAGSQKALMCPPGLAFASVSERALDAAGQRPGGRYYFDWARTAKSQAGGASPFTPAVSLFLGLDVALEMIEAEGLEDVWARHHAARPRHARRRRRARARALRRPRRALDGRDRDRAAGLDVDGGKVPGALRKLGITANGGQDHLKGRILRIAHCGYFGAFDILTSLSGLEMALSQLGHEVEHGAGVGAAQRVFVEAGVAAAAASERVLERAVQGPGHGEDRRLRRRACCASASTSTSVSTGRTRSSRSASAATTGS